VGVSPLISQSFAGFQALLECSEWCGNGKKFRLPDWCTTLLVPLRRASANLADVVSNGIVVE
jgi:hypothetical protein